jgi:hypothetical protein
LTGTSSVSIDGETGLSCAVNLRQTGTATLSLQTASSGAITGTLQLNGTQTVSSNNCGIPDGLIPSAPFAHAANVEGSGNNIRFTQEFRDSQTIDGISISSVVSIAFTGTISGGGVNGTLTYNSTVDWSGLGVSGRGTVTGSINLSLR